MSITIKQTKVIGKLYPQIFKIVGDIAYDANGNEVAYSLEEVNAKITADQAAETAAKQASLSKLTALGLTADDVKNILGS
jgi:hypothetical protein